MKSYSVILIVFLCLFSASPAWCLQIQLHDQARVTEGTIHLGDLASSIPEDPEAEQWLSRTVGHSPAPGKSKTIQSKALIQSLQHVEGAEKINWSGANSITVTRQGIELKKEQLKQIIAEFLQQNLTNLPDAEFRFTSVRAQESIVLPTGKLSYTVTPSKPGILGSSSFSITFQIDGKTVKHCTVRGKLEAMADVATAAVNLRKGEIIAANHLVMQRQDISKLETPCPAIDLAIGLEVKRYIRAGKAIDSRNVQPAPIIRKGEPVKIIASKGALRLSTNGVAIMNGRPGEFIRVKNINSDKLVYCKVDAPGVVSVEF